MNRERLRSLLEQVRGGSVEIDEALQSLTVLPYEDLGYAKVDHHRALRKGFPEVVYGQGKTPEQVVGIVDSLARDGGTVLVTRTEEAVYRLIAERHKNREWHQGARAVLVNPPSEPKYAGTVAVFCAGTADLPVAAEAALTARAMGCAVESVNDVGVAGLHRLLDHLELLRSARVVIVVAGMDGALPSAVGGLTAAPVVAVPTSAGYGASFGGLSALLTMLNSCASGVTVVNIDNGFGAGYFAGLVLARTQAY